MWEAIMDRREVGILGIGKMMGPALYRNALELFFSTRIFWKNILATGSILRPLDKDYHLECYSYKYL